MTLSVGGKATEGAGMLEVIQVAFSVMVVVGRVLTRLTRCLVKVRNK